MKKLFAVLALVFTLTLARAADVELVGFWVGAWYETSVPKTYVRSAGELRIYMWSDGTLDADFSYVGDVTVSGTGTWTRNIRGVSKVFFTMANGNVFRGGGKDDFWLGSFKLPLVRGSVLGKWQTT